MLPLHGDVHDGNQFIDGNTPGFLDWAIVSRAPAARDVGYYLAGVLRPEDCAQFEALLAFYRQQLQAGGIEPPDSQSLLDQCRWHAAYVWVGAVATLAMGEAWQPSSYVLRTLQNLHANLESLQTVPALRDALD